jgi:PPOX class probable F420-dependent enzyme
MANAARRDLEMAEMSPKERDAFLYETRIAKLATLNPDGSPNVVPVWFEWDGAEVRVFTLDTSPKVRRIQRDERVAFSVEQPVGVREAWVTIEGTAQVEPGGYALAERLAPRYYEANRSKTALGAWAEQRDHWVVLRITPVRIRSSAS